MADTLRDRIFDGEIAPGSHLMEISLANELGVSRTPVRGAMARLADEGLLVYLPNKGFQVRRFNAKDVYDAFSVRATLEGMC
ncbi:MAG TPA: GntR family transcriptional regulator, partial [Burkholderiaceae bacterium]